ncbi:MAG: flavodoxin family protein [Syntrophomonadaceae bacterium]|nr:flavodoxin family protein [Syntrophomonadaceae bacterium]
MKIVAINGGPRKGQVSKTTMMLEAFLEGCRKAGAEVEVINLREKTINMCIGCYTCWVKTPGVCVHKDDMKDILDIRKGADVEVWATPLYIFGPTAMFKNFLDRSIPLYEPYIVEKDGLCAHPPRVADQVSDIVVISVAGFYELDHFRPMSDWLHFMAGRGLGRIGAEIYRSSAEFMSAPPLKPLTDKILEATKKAGEEYVRDGRIHEDTMKAIQLDIMPDQETFLKQANAFWDWDIDRWKKRRAGKQS